MEEATRSAFGKNLALLGEKYPEIVTIDADLSGSTKTGEFAKKFPERAFNVGISEQDLVGTAAGLAVAGKRPFAASFAVFITGRGWEQIRNTVATSKLPVVIVGSHAGILTGEDGETHQALEDVAVLRSIHNMTIFCPSDFKATELVLNKIMEDVKGPCYLRLGRDKVPRLYEDKASFDPFKVQVLTKGSDLVFFASGACVHQTLKAAKKLEEEEINVSVVDVNCLKPIDKKGVVENLIDQKLCITVEDHSTIGGLGSAVSEIITEEGLNVKLSKIGMTSFGESGTPADLYLKFGLDAAGIFEHSLDFVKKNRK